MSLSVSLNPVLKKSKKGEEHGLILAAWNDRCHS